MGLDELVTQPLAESSHVDGMALLLAEKPRALPLEDLAPLLGQARVFGRVVIFDALARDFNAEFVSDELGDLRGGFKSRQALQDNDFEAVG